MSDFDHCDENDLMDCNESPSLSSRKVLFSDSAQLEIENSSTELMDSVEQEKLQCLKEQHIVENFTTEDESFSTPLNKTANSKSHEPIVETLAQSLDTLSLHQGQDVPEVDISLAENPGKKDLQNYIFSTQELDKRGETDNARVFPCPKKLLSYNLPQTNRELFELSRDDISGASSMATDEKININSTRNKLDIQHNNKSSDIKENFTDKKTSSVQNQPLDDLKKNLFEDDVFEDAAETDVRSRKLGRRIGLRGGDHSFKIPENRTVEYVKSVSCSSTLGLGGRDISIFIQG